MKRKDYYTTRMFSGGYAKTYYPPMHYTMHAEGDLTFASKGQNLGKRNLPRKVKKWVRTTFQFQPNRWKPWWTGQNRKLTTPVPAGILRTRKRKH